MVRGIECHGKARQEEDPEDTIIETTGSQRTLTKAWFSGRGNRP